MPRSRKPPTAATGLPYGEAGKLQAAQAAMPLPSAPSAPQGVPPAITAAQNAPPPSEGFTTPSDNPTALPTHGLPIGPGPGPEALPDPASYIPSPDDSWILARWLPLLEDSGRGPDGSSEIRQMVRRLRGMLPSDVTQQALVQQTQGPQYPPGTPTVNVGQITGGLSFDPNAKLDPSQVRDTRSNGGGSWG